MPITAAEAWQAYRDAAPIYTLEQVEQALDRMAEQITADLRDTNPILLCVMNGGLMPVARLATRLEFPLWIDYIHATRYRGATTGSDLRWMKRPGEPLHNRSVLVVDDILDEGITLHEIVEFCRAEGASQIRSAVLVKKLHDRCNGFVADYVGLEVEDRYVFGYGMDYKCYLRNAPGIFAIAE